MATFNERTIIIKRWGVGATPICLHSVANNLQNVISLYIWIICEMHNNYSWPIKTSSIRRFFFFLSFSLSLSNDFEHLSMATITRLIIVPSILITVLQMFRFIILRPFHQNLSFLFYFVLFYNIFIRLIFNQIFYHISKFSPLILFLLCLCTFFYCHFMLQFYYNFPFLLLNYFLSAFFIAPQVFCCFFNL